MPNSAKNRIQADNLFFCSTRTFLFFNFLKFSEGCCPRMSILGLELRMEISVSSLVCMSLRADFPRDAGRHVVNRGQSLFPMCCFGSDS
ncbi:hypothetical protein GDO78_016655 [Eleutherodactylus coqui]|uniref:Uncharacterized protein n=1 Tax=Eleutherodactylus coqui TaxID=57060 RepID=A0A8J6EAC7_ELECQ|nr:hypothetical protein GDO78_016655 [Eleutherodactylus coqui]